ncbi:MAG: DUF1501 domain-containing protein [Armatimonadetes bacterium]|nr:DUF1501 domain-containing protein [Armatimonadota bacterium]
MSITRRSFLVGCSSAIAAMSGAKFGNLSFYDDPGSNPILVTIFLRGGMDGLNLLAPINDPDYIAARPANLRIGESGDRKGLEIAGGPKGLDFRLFGKANEIKELYDSKHLAFVHACGLTHGTRSHFEAMDLMERGVARTEDMGLGSGWMARHLKERGATGPMPAVSVAGNLANMFLGAKGAAAIPNLDGFQLWGGDDQINALRLLYSMGESWIHRDGLDALTAFDQIRKKMGRNPDGSIPKYQPSGGAQYPDGELGNALRDLARIIKMEVGLQAATVDYGGWDTHQDQEYHFMEHTVQLSKSLGAFYADLADFRPRLTVIVMSEFGRRLKANQSQGTDHGHGNVMMVMSPKVKGGQIHGKWPGLATDQLDARADLAITTDYRHVLCEILGAEFGEKDGSKLFPLMGAPKPVGLY